MVKAYLLFFGNVLQNPNAVDSKVTVEFDHVKNGLKIDVEGLIQFLYSIKQFIIIQVFV